jgi:hypothetical protein
MFTKTAVALGAAAVSPASANYDRSDRVCVLPLRWPA